MINIRFANVYIDSRQHFIHLAKYQAFELQTVKPPIEKRCGYFLFRFMHLRMPYDEIDYT